MFSAELKKENIMLKRVVAAGSLLAMSLCANADFVVSQSSITGADMAGMEVTVMFADGSTDSGVWSVISNTALSTGDPIIDMNGFSGGVTAADWSLTQSGLTLGGVDDAGTFYGLWSLVNNNAASDITGFSVNGFTANSLIAFDVRDDVVGTPGSDSGMAFVSDLPASGAGSNAVNVAFDDLFWQLDVMLGSGLAATEELRFFVDTDAMAVSAPATMSLVFGGLVLLARRKAFLAVK